MPRNRVVCDGAETCGDGAVVEQVVLGVGTFVGRGSRPQVLSGPSDVRSDVAQECEDVRGRAGELSRPPLHHRVVVGQESPEVRMDDAMVEAAAAERHRDR